MTQLPPNATHPTDFAAYVSERWGPRLLLVHPTAPYIYMAHWDLHRISGYRFDDVGVLTPLPGSPWPTGCRPRAITIDPLGRFLYSGNWESGNVTGYAIDAQTGSLQPLPGSPYRVGRRPRNLRLDATGSFGYVSNRDDQTISMFTVDPATGALRPIAPGRVNVGTLPRTTVINYDGTLAAAGHQHADTISIFTIDPQTRALTPLTDEPIHVGADPRSVTFHPKGPWLYIANRASGDMTVLAIDAAARSVREVPGSPFVTGALPFAMQFHPSLQFGYAACPGTHDIHAYHVSADTGALAALATSPFAAGTFPVWPTFDPAGRFLFINAYDSNDIHAFAVNLPDGSLTPAPGGPWRAGSARLRGTHPREMLTDMQGRLLFVPNCRADTLSTFRIDPQTGSLTPCPGSPFPPTGTMPLQYHWLVTKHAAKSIIGRHRAHPADGVRKAQTQTQRLAIDCRTPPVIIFGAARCGTTMITDILRRMGLFIGENGIREDLEVDYFSRANDTIIKRAHGYWDHPAAMTYLLRDAATVEQTARCLRNDLCSPRIAGYMGWRRYLQAGGVGGIDIPWGWKDPRNTFTLPFWLCLFPTARLICIKRNGVDMAASLRALERSVIARRNAVASRAVSRWRYRSALERHSFKGAARCLHLDGAMSLWEEYMDQIETVLERATNPRYCLRYEDFLAEPRKHITEMRDFCGLNADNALMDQLASGIDTSRAFAFRGDRELLAFYQQVRTRPSMVREGYDQCDQG